MRFLAIKIGPVIRTRLLRFDGYHSSCFLARTAPTRRGTAPSLRETPTMLVRCLIYLFTHSSGFVASGLRQ